MSKRKGHPKMKTFRIKYLKGAVMTIRAFNLQIAKSKAINKVAKMLKINYPMTWKQHFPLGQNDLKIIYQDERRANLSPRKNRA